MVFNKWERGRIFKLGRQRVVYHNGGVQKSVPLSHDGGASSKGKNVPFVKMEYRPMLNMNKNAGERKNIKKGIQVSENASVIKIGNKFDVLSDVSGSKVVTSWEDQKKEVDIWFPLKCHPPNDVKVKWSENQLEYYCDLCAKQPMDCEDDVLSLDGAPEFMKVD